MKPCACRCSARGAQDPVVLEQAIEHEIASRAKNGPTRERGGGRNVPGPGSPVRRLDPRTPVGLCPLEQGPARSALERLPLPIATGTTDCAPRAARPATFSPMRSVNPATGEPIAEYPEHDPGEVQRRLEHAAAAFASWRRTSFAERSIIMRAAARALRQSRDRFARLMTTEMGKPIVQAEEIGRAHV